MQAYLIQVLHHRQPQLFLEKLGQIVGIVAEMRCNILHHDLFAVVILDIPHDVLDLVDGTIPLIDCLVRQPDGIGMHQRIQQVIEQAVELEQIRIRTHIIDDIHIRENFLDAFQPCDIHRMFGVHIHVKFQQVIRRNILFQHSAGDQQHQRLVFLRRHRMDHSGVDDGKFSGVQRLAHVVFKLCHHAPLDHVHQFQAVVPVRRNIAAAVLGQIKPHINIGVAGHDLMPNAVIFHTAPHFFPGIAFHLIIAYCLHFCNDSRKKVFSTKFKL